MTAKKSKQAKYVTPVVVIPQPDLVNYPSHYTSHPSGVECITVAEHMSFSVGSAMKYLWRAGFKGKEIEDLKKAVWHINREIDRLSR